MITPMFPLGTVLFPGGILPLHVFEPRYRAMVRTCLDEGTGFGVVLIERGSEVGGGDVRTDVGTLARIAEAQESADGRWAVLAVGAARIRVVEWLDDDPYPRAETEPWPDPEPGPDFDDRLAAVLHALRRVVALRGEVGETTTPVPNELSEDRALASHQASWLAPVPTIDHQRLLVAASPDDRLDLLGRLLMEEAEVLELRLGGS